MSPILNSWMYGPVPVVTGAPNMAFSQCGRQSESTGTTTAPRQIVLPAKGMTGLRFGVRVAGWLRAREAFRPKLLTRTWTPVAGGVPNALSKPRLTAMVPFCCAMLPRFLGGV